MNMPERRLLGSRKPLIELEIDCVIMSPIADMTAEGEVGKTKLSAPLTDTPGICGLLQLMQRSVLMAALPVSEAMSAAETDLSSA